MDETKDDSKEMDRKKTLRTLRPLPTAVEADSFAAPSFNYEETSGISKTAVGQGCQAFIYSVVRKNSAGETEKFAIKVLKPALAKKSEEMRAFQREVNLLGRLSHDNICCIVAVGSTPQGVPCALLEWVETTVSNDLKLDEVGSFSEVRTGVIKKRPNAFRIKMVRELAEAMRYLHSGTAVSNCIVLHRDLKPDNYGITESGQLKLLDFGLAVCLLKAEGDSPTCDMKYSLTGETGSSRYMAPEVGRCEDYGVGADIYSFAVSAWEMLLLKGKPYGSFGVAEHSRLVIRGTTRPPIPSSWHPELNKILSAAWDPDASNRPGFDKIVNTLKGLEQLQGEDPLGSPKGCLC